MLDADTNVVRADNSISILQNGKILPLAYLPPHFVCKISKLHYDN